MCASAPTDAPPAPRVGAPARKPDDKPVQVEITTPEPTGWGLYQTIFATLLPPLATAGIVQDPGRVGALAGEAVALALGVLAGHGSSIGPAGH